MRLTTASADLRLGRYQDVLADVECDAVITDPPFGARTHDGYRSGRDASDKYERAQVDYTHWREDDCRSFVSFWAPRCRGWMAVLTDSDLCNFFRGAMEDAGRITFAPVACVTPGMTVRLAGDGPSSWTLWLCVSRPRQREYQRWGTLPGAYITPQAGGESVRGWGLGAYRGGGGGGRGKPAGLMRAIVSDYSRPGDLVCDPCAGYGSTLAAALTKGRRAVGAEVDAEVHAEALRRLAGVQVVDLFADDMRGAKQSEIEL